MSEEFQWTASTAFKVYVVPEHIRESLLAYANEHRPVGSFLEAVISNDLKEALGRADAENIDNLFAIVSWLYNYAPSPCWGSPERYAAWVKR